ncbi:OpgC family protein [Tropicimonas sp. IMCC34011]|uniref:OpgC family protein n=1 Tax=Tropicimonas sp. IMCC34011 TaxID=2248759 RepID=UPI000E252F45|nr:OpgC domain-containing protein [Tropicimonas sp. IMCC34011]
MTATDILPAAPPQVAATIPAAARDIRLDFFRGVAMFLIFIAHMPGNFLNAWLPTRFGFSDATEIFVFCSGAASGIAFGRVYDRSGFAIGTARIGLRVWQLYWAHIGFFFALAATLAAIDGAGLFDKDYVNSLNLTPFFADPEALLPALMTLTYVPNYFDILPMYMGALALVPLMMAAARIAPAAAIALSVGIWFVAAIEVLHLPAEPWSDREWFFNPFGWQLVFFTGFALTRGWIRTPPVTWGLVTAALILLVLTMPFAYWRFYIHHEWILSLREAARPLLEKTDLGLFRYLYFLVLAYAAYALSGPEGRALRATPAGMAGQLWGGLRAAIVRVGQRSLAVFVFSMALSRIAGLVLDVTGRTPLLVLAVTIAGCTLMVGVAYGTGWLMSEPWRKRTSS